MYCIVEASIGGVRTKCVLLAVYRRDIEQTVYRKGLFGRKVRYRREERSRCLLFVPYRHALKDIVEIDESELLYPISSMPPEFVRSAAFTSRFLLEENYFSEFEVRDFCGYEFVLNDTSFIGNVAYGYKDISLKTLYEYDKAFAELDIE